MAGSVRLVLLAKGRILLERRGARSPWTLPQVPRSDASGVRAWVDETVGAGSVDVRDRADDVVLATVAERRTPAMGTLAWRHPTLLGETEWSRYRQVAPEVADVLGDHENGASTVSRRALTVLRDRSADGTIEELRALAERLATGRPDLVAVATRIDRVMDDATDAPTVLERCERAIDRAATVDRRAGRRAGRMFVGAEILTLSRSGTVAEALVTARPRHVTVLESRPGEEGRATAASLGDRLESVDFVPDAAVSVAMRSADVVLIGADAIDATGAVHNKLGTRPLATAAADGGVPVIAISSTDKVVPSIPGSEAVAMVSDEPHARPVPIFETTPSRLVTILVTERGPITGADRRDLARAVETRRQWRST